MYLLTDVWVWTILQRVNSQLHFGEQVLKIIPRSHEFFKHTEYSCCFHFIRRWKLQASFCSGGEEWEWLSAITCSRDTCRVMLRVAEEGARRVGCAGRREREDQATVASRTSLIVKKTAAGASQSNKLELDQRLPVFHCACFNKPALCSLNRTSAHVVQL